MMTLASRQQTPTAHKQSAPAPQAVQTAPEPAIFVLFGITGHLSKTKLLPSLYHLLKKQMLHERTQIVGSSRHQLTVEDVLTWVKNGVPEADPKVLDDFKARLHLVKVDPVNQADYTALLKTLNDIEAEQGMCMNRVFYLSIPPQVYAPVIKNLGEEHLNEGCPHRVGVTRLMVEKPFGYDLASAKELIEDTRPYFTEEQLFRIDHYLAKETAQNLVTFREQNPLFAAVWNRHHITSVDLLFSEPMRVQDRADFYDGVGALRDVIQNHLFQLMALMTMDMPHKVTSDSLHAAKEALFKSIPTIDLAKETVHRGQYDGYQTDVSNPGSTTETYASFTLHIDNDRWQGVPVTLTAGKALAIKLTSITVTMTDPHRSGAVNKLTFRIVPDEGIDIGITVKRPGLDQRAELADMDFSYAREFKTEPPVDAYVRVISDALKGDHSLFATETEVLESWRIVEPIVQAWQRDSKGMISYEPGTAAPLEA